MSNVMLRNIDRLKTLRRRVEWNLPVSSIHFFVKLAPEFKLIGGQIADWTVQVVKFSVHVICEPDRRASRTSPSSAGRGGAFILTVTLVS